MLNLFGKSREYELQLELDKAKATILQLKEENEGYKQSFASTHLATGKYERQVDEVKAKYEATVKELTDKLKETEKSVNRKVNKALQNIGVTEFCSEIPIPVASSDTELYEKYIKMPNGKDKTDFFNKNEASIRRAIGL